MTLICKQYLNQQLGNISFLGFSQGCCLKILDKGFPLCLRDFFNNYQAIANIQSNQSILANFNPCLFSYQLQTNSSKLKFFGQNRTKIELIDWVFLFASPITQFQSILSTFHFLPNQNKPSKLKLLGHNWTKIEDFIGHYLENLNPLFLFSKNGNTLVFFCFSQCFFLFCSQMNEQPSLLF